MVTSVTIFIHNFCHECPRKVRHIYHLQHPITLIDPDDETRAWEVRIHLQEMLRLVWRRSWKQVLSMFYLWLLLGSFLREKISTCNNHKSEKSWPPTRTLPSTVLTPLWRLWVWSTYQSRFTLVSKVITWSIRVVSPYHALSRLRVIPIASLTLHTSHKTLYHVGSATRQLILSNEVSNQQ